MLYIVRTKQIKDDNFKPLEQPNNVYLAIEYEGSIGLAYFTKIFQNAKTFISPEQAKTFIKYNNLILKFEMINDRYRNHWYLSCNRFTCIC